MNNKWKGAIALTAAGVMLAGTALAQGKTQESAQPRTPVEGKQDQMTPKGEMKSQDQMKMDRMKSPDSKSGREKGMTQDKDEAIKAVQQALKGKGYDPGPIDGLMGPNTTQALKSFQKAEGLKDTGRLDMDTRQKLGIEGTGKPQS